jgi:hypothetical protein
MLMAFADPQSITINAVTSSLPRTNVQNNKAEYTSADGLVKLTASHAYGRRNRRVLRVDHSKIAADLFIPSQNAKLSMSNYIVFDVPTLGYSTTEAKQVYDGFKALFTGTSDALIVKLLAGES